MKKVTFKRNEKIFSENDPSGCMYQIVSGKVSITATKKDGSQKELTTLDSKAYFGEMGIIEGAPRSATATAVSDVEAVEIEKDSFTSFVVNNPGDVIAIMKHLSERLRKITKDYSVVAKDIEEYVELSEKSVEKVDLWYKLSQLSKNALRELSEVTESEAGKDSFNAGAVIFKKGQKGSFMYKILEGEVAFYEKYGTLDQIELSKSERGSLFGELAVIDGTRRSADAVAVTPVKLERVASSQLEVFLENHPEDAIKILKNLSSKLRFATERYIEALKTISDCVKESGMAVEGSIWDSFINYSSMYNDYSVNDIAVPGAYFGARMF